MINVETKYLGLKLDNPLIVSSSGLTGSVSKIENLANNGAGAIVLKSLFEEQINSDAYNMLRQSDYPEATDYIMNYVRNNSVDEYLHLIEETKRLVDIPVMASINCISSAEWVSFAKSIQDAGAAAIELNLFFLPVSLHDKEGNYEQMYYDILTDIAKEINIPVAVKIGQNITNIPLLVSTLYGRGAKGVVLFNRFYSPDIDVETMSITSSEVFSSSEDMSQSLRWIGIVSSLVDKVDLCASTGIHDSRGIIKQLLAGASAVQICSAIYKNGAEYMMQLLDGLTEWMEKHNFESISEFRGRMSYKNIPDPAVFERSQFMRYFSDKE